MYVLVKKNMTIERGGCGPREPTGEMGQCWEGLGTRNLKEAEGRSPQGATLKSERERGPGKGRVLQGRAVLRIGGRGWRCVVDRGQMARAEK